MTPTYDFTSGDDAGQHGTLNFTRVGPMQLGCSLYHIGTLRPKWVHANGRTLASSYKN